MNRFDIYRNTLERTCPLDYAQNIGWKYSDFQKLKDIIFEVMAEDADNCNTSFGEDELEDVLYSMNEYISRYPSIPAFKQRLWAFFNAWANNIMEKCQLEIEWNIDSILHKPIEESTAIGVVKCLHSINAEGGMTKAEMAERLNVSTKAIQNTLHTLDPKLEKNKTNPKQAKRQEPFRFGGQILEVSIAFEDEMVSTSNGDTDRNLKKHERRFYAPDTLSPIALQLNVSQTAILLRSLQESYDSEISNTSWNIALNIWTQLSDYTKDRIMNYTFPDNKEFHNLLNQLSEEENSDRPYSTEKEMFENETIETKLQLAYKSVIRCNIEFDDGRIVHDCFVRFNHNRNKYTCEKDEMRETLEPDHIIDMKIYELDI